MGVDPGEQKSAFEPLGSQSKAEGKEGPGSGEGGTLANSLEDSQVRVFPSWVWEMCFCLSTSITLFTL